MNQESKSLKNLGKMPQLVAGHNGNLCFEILHGAENDLMTWTGRVFTVYL